MIYKKFMCYNIFVFAHINNCKYVNSALVLNKHLNNSMLSQQP